MKLKTKFQDEDFDLGEVVEANIYHGGSGRFKVIAEPAKGGIITFYFETLKGMNEMFEGYEEPKALGWRIDEYNDPEEIGFGFSLEELEYLKEIGLLFKTKEETEKAVEKLKAWKRLKDKGFRFEDFEETDRGKLGDFTIYAHIEPDYLQKYDEFDDDLYLLFGGER